MPAPARRTRPLGMGRLCWCLTWRGSGRVHALSQLPSHSLQEFSPLCRVSLGGYRDRSNIGVHAAIALEQQGLVGALRQRVGEAVAEVELRRMAAALAEVAVAARATCACPAVTGSRTSLALATRWSICRLAIGSQLESITIAVSSSLPSTSGATDLAPARARAKDSASGSLTTHRCRRSTSRVTADHEQDLRPGSVMGAFIPDPVQGRLRRLCPLPHRWP